jgi:hypothetical protein
MDAADCHGPFSETKEIRVTQALLEVIEDIDLLISMLSSLRWPSIRELECMEDL